MRGGAPDAAPLGTWAPPAGFGDGDGDDLEHDDRVRRELTDLGNARRFAADHADRLRYVVQRGQWLAWRAGRWREDDDGEHVRAAKKTAEAMLAEAMTLDGDERKRAIKHALASQDEPRLRRMLELARTEPGLALTVERLDADPWLLACQNGTINLRTGDLRPHDPTDILTLGTDIDYHSDAACDRWQRFLLEVFDGDQELVSFVQRAVGYSLTGDTREHALFICHGSGANGKTTFLEAIKRLLGGLAATAAFDSFARARGDRGPRDDLARLHRARLVAAAEAGDGRRLDEAVVKQLTGGDTIAARPLYGKHLEFRPQFKLWLATNHRPRVDGADDAIWRRIRLVPFNVSFTGREDRELAQALEAELPGILAWAVNGCLAWQEHGLGSAQAVDAATRDYREAEDVLGAFISERCHVGPGCGCDAGVLRAAYEDFCREIGENPLGTSALGRAIAKRGYGVERAMKGRRYRGLEPMTDDGYDGTSSNSSRVRAYEGLTDSGVMSVICHGDGADADTQKPPLSRENPPQHPPQAKNQHPEIDTPSPPEAPLKAAGGRSRPPREPVAAPFPGGQGS